MGDAQRLPCKTEPRRPYDAVCVREGLLLISQYPTSVGLIWIMAEGIQWSRKPSKAAIFTNRIGLVIGAQSQSQRQVGTGVPLLLAVKSETIESEMVPSR